jgi:hypothetical protein
MQSVSQSVMCTPDGLDSSGSGQGPVAGSCAHGNEPTGSIKGGQFLD